MKTIKKLLKYTCILLISANVISCTTDEGMVKLPATSNGEISNLNITPQGNVTETENGYIVVGSLTIATAFSGDVILNNANLDVEFNDDRTLSSISGVVTDVQDSFIEVTVRNDFNRQHYRNHYRDL